ncbi:unnamed protein product, partial [Medioppia subpectinata]
VDGNIKVRTNSIYPRLEEFALPSTKNAVTQTLKEQSSCSQQLCGSFIPPSTTPTPVQKYAIPIILAKQSILVRAPTGMGKTLCFLLPLLENLDKLKPKNKSFNSNMMAKGLSKSTSLRICVISPTRELCDQIKDQCELILRNNSEPSSVNVTSPWLPNRDVVFGSKSNFSDDSSNKGTSNSNFAYKNLKVESVYGRKKELYSYDNVDIIIATPGRLLDLLIRNKIDFTNLEAFVLDEADKLLDMGFEVDIRKIYSYVSKNKTDTSKNSSAVPISNGNSVQICLFSATYNKNLNKIITDFLGENKFIVEVENETVENISQKIIYCNNKDQELVKILEKLNFSSSWKSNQSADKCLIFVEKKKTAVELERKINDQSILSNTRNINTNKGSYNWYADSVHGDKDQDLRSLAIKKFRENRTHILIATSVAARGIDIDDIKIVINYDFPREIKEYIHRIGRTGRSGKAGEAISFVERGDSVLTNDVFRNDLISVLLESKNEVPELIKQKTNYPHRGTKKILVDQISNLSINKISDQEISDSSEDEKEDSEGDATNLW